MSKQPTFLFCVGATKAGTSWLYEHLSAHPECHFRTIKELHYFTLKTEAQFDGALRGVDRQIAEMQARLDAAAYERKAVVAQRLADLIEWRAVLAHLAIDLPAYRAFLTKGAGEARLVGDVTPAYGLMVEQDLAGLARVAADTRFVYLIRDPLARLWSHVRMIAARTAPDRLAQAAEAQMAAILDGDLSGEGKGIVARGDYARILPKLLRAVPAKSLLVQFQEELMTLPGIAKLSAHLGLSAAPAALDRRVHEGKSVTLPEALRARALLWLRPQYDYVAAMFPALPEAWRKNMEKGFA
ncbi:sulfotransferase [Cypionkella sp.]|uniref:sulfotransferase n=1 Tax=Cypionkella sp. TaxID=2811411 RepID=UPI002ABC3862|nr:sulfotransferase [Cypionkella sp.]MDZ4395197.1 sulfotransferase [Cypionkella sp.]